MLAADGQNIRKMEANGQDNKANDAAPSASFLVFSFFQPAPPFPSLFPGVLTGGFSCGTFTDTTEFRG